MPPTQQLRVTCDNRELKRPYVCTTVWSVERTVRVLILVYRYLCMPIGSSRTHYVSHFFHLTIFY